MLFTQFNSFVAHLLSPIHIALLLQCHPTLSSPWLILTISFLYYSNASLYYILQHGLEWVIVLLLFHLRKAGSEQTFQMGWFYSKTSLFLKRVWRKNQISIFIYILSVLWIFVLAVWRLLVSLFCSWWWGQLLCPLIASALEVPLILALDSCYFFCDIEFFHYWT